MHEMREYWLWQWMEANGIDSLDSARCALSKRRVLDDVTLRASEYLKRYPSDSHLPDTIMAGRALDLSGHLDCYAWDCLRQRVDALFLKIWHYFNRVAIVAANAADFTEVWEDVAFFEERLMLYVNLLLHLRDIGAERLVLFVQKPALDQDQFDPQTPFVREIIDNEQHIAWLEKGSVVRDVRQHGDHFHYRFDHPGMEHTTWGAVHGIGAAYSPPALLRVVSQAVAARFAAHLQSDIQAARNFKCPIGVGINYHKAIMAESMTPTIEQVMFQLKLPILKGISTSDLLHLRETEKPHFLAFRTALLKAANERIAKGNSTDAIAAEIQYDVIEPSILELTRRLVAAERNLKKKASVRLGLGALTTACGLLISNPTLIAAGAATSLSALGPIDTYSDARKEIEMADMYFLLRAKSHAH